MFYDERVGEDLFIAELERTRLNRKMTVSVCQTGVGTDNRDESGCQNSVGTGNRPCFPQPHKVPPYFRNPSSRIYPRAQFSPYPCRYCNNGQKHLPKDCPRGPRPGACFECLDVNHRQGSDVCLGRENPRKNIANGPTNEQR